MARYSRPTDPVNLVDFSKPHDSDDYLHYSFSVINDGVKLCRMYESIEKSTNSVVYRGSISYHERKDPEEYQYRLLKRKGNVKEFVRKNTDEELLDEYVDISSEDLLQKKMKEMLTKSIEPNE